MKHYGEMIYSMAKLADCDLKEIAKKARYTEQGFYTIVKKKDLNTSVIKKFARACGREITIDIK